MQPTEEMISRFLQWQLPEDFNPDGGISFKRGSWEGKPYPMPVGTNLLDYTQAKAMLEFVLATTPDARIASLRQGAPEGATPQAEKKTSDSEAQ